MKCLIVDDNIQEMELLSYLIGNEPNLELMGVLDNVVEAYAFIRRHQPPLLFMDIKMPLIKGTDLFKKLSFYQPICIFVSSYSEYALESYEAMAFDFILKPVTIERFDKCIKRVLEYDAMRKRSDLFEATFESKTILVKEGISSVRVALKDILYIEALNNYSKIITDKQYYLTLSKLKYFLERLPGTDFIRIHRSYAVARQFVEKMTGNNILVAGRELPVGKTFRTQIRKILSEN